ncbi:transposase family protein [Spiroplasma poulsonii]|uniref:Transposase family protein n=1 Tax=Spiroplasma poulsonii TaxID=2138 RepID=A0A433ER90_9MOLU|nr:transposase family protein [Spiroplasma poulsonii]RUP77112.1 transposase family protein [Spiroplasma poulsonii]
MTLLYWREYQTYFHLGKSFDISEANCYRNIKWIEDILIKNSDFQQLAGKKALINRLLAIPFLLKYYYKIDFLHYLLKNCKYL